jgi:DNA-binding NarL/FixJ family response regulator
MTASAIRTVAIVEDDPIVAGHLVRAIEGDAALQLLGTAASVAQARALLRQRPDVAVLDLGLADGSGIDLLRVREAEGYGDCRFLVLTVFGDETSVMAALAAGADGYLVKDMEPEHFLLSLHETLEGGAPLSASVATYLLKNFRRGSHGPDPMPDVTAKLSAREIELLRLFSIGRTNKEAARELRLSPHTVSDYVKGIYRKLRVRSRAAAVSKAINGHLIEP